MMVKTRPCSGDAHVDQGQREVCPADVVMSVMIGSGGGYRILGL